MIGNCTVTESSGWVTGKLLVALFPITPMHSGWGAGVKGNGRVHEPFAFLYLRPMGRIKRSYLTGRRVKSGPTKVLVRRISLLQSRK